MTNEKRSNLQLAIDAYQRGNKKEFDHHFTKMWIECKPAIQATIRKHVKEPDRREDAEQDAFFKVLAAIKNWRGDRAVGADTAIIKWLAAKASLNTVENRDRIQAHEHATLAEPATRDTVEFRYSELHPTNENEGTSLDDFAEYAAGRAGTLAQGKKWRAIIHAVAEGHVDRESIGKYIGSPAVTVRREIHSMRQVLNLKALDQQEVIVSWTETDSPHDTDAPAHLFEFDFKEIN